MNYQDFKDKIAVHKDKIVLGACFVLVFVVGFGSGRYVKKPSTTTQTQSYYTTSSTKKPLTQAPAEGDGGAPAVAGVSTGTTATIASSTAAATGACIVKGNISSGNKKIYHVKGGAFYDRVKPEQCFNTPAEAEAAGFVKSQR